MKDFENIGKRMPFAETDDYVSQLVSRATEQAISHHTGRKNPIRQWAVAATLAVLLAGAGVTYYHLDTAQQPQVTAQTESPLDNFLNNLSDDEASLLAYYDMDEEIPEY